MKLCPICSNKLLIDMEVSDYFHTKETFYLHKCKSCQTKFTYPIPDNLDKYYDTQEYLSHFSDNKNIKSLIYRFIRNLMLNYKYKKLFNLFHGKSILDYGCGSGNFVTYLRNMKENIIGYEPHEILENNNKKIKKYILSEKDKLIKKKFDVITFWHVLEHVEDIDNFLHFISGIHKEKGVIIIALPNHLSCDSRLYKKFWAGYDVPRHLYHFSKVGIEKLMKKHNYTFINKIPLIFDSFFVSLLSEKYQNSTFPWLKGFINGFLSNISAIKTKEFSSNIFIFKKNENEL